MSLLLDAIRHIEARRPDAPTPASPPAPLIAAEPTTAGDTGPEHSMLAEIAQVQSLFAPLADDEQPSPVVETEIAVELTPLEPDEFTRTAGVLAARHPNQLHSTLALCAADGVTTDIAQRLAAVWSTVAAGDVLLIEGHASPNGGHDGLPGVIDAFNGQCDPLDVIQPTARPDVFRLSAGLGPLTKLDFRRAAECARAWRARFRFVLVDLGEAQGELASALLTISTSVYVLISLRHTPRAAAEQLLERLRRADMRDIAAIAVDG